MPAVQPLLKIEQAAEPKRILIVEDEAIVALDIQHQLQTLGYEVVGRAISAFDAVRKAGEFHPDLVLMDIHLESGSDGVVAAEEITRQHQIPVVFLTAYMDEPTLLRAKQAQPYGYIVKPFNPGEVHTTLQVALHKAQGDRQLQQSYEELAAIFETQRHGTVAIDEKHNVTFVSSRARQILDINVGAVNRPWTALLRLTAEDAASFDALLKAEPSAHAKLLVARDSSDGNARKLELEVVEDPRDPLWRFVFLDDLSRPADSEQRLATEDRLGGLIGKSKSMHDLFSLIREIARVDSSVLIEGETGSGKELVARAIHDLGKRSNGPFVALNCAGLSEELAASQLFGHRKGAFTGAAEDQPGLFEAAHRGTLFLDEIGELPPRIQATLLRVLEEGAVLRVGDTQTRKLDVRIVCATNRDLAIEAKQGRFRLDLLYRIRVARLHVPPLRAQREDIPLIAEFFLKSQQMVTGKALDQFSDRALVVLQAYDWPGNVRELKNAIEFGAIRAVGSILDAADLPPEVNDPNGAIFSDQQTERGRILAALECAHGNRKEAAKVLGISRATLYRKLSELKLD